MVIVSDRKIIYEQKITELQRLLAKELMDTYEGNKMLGAIPSEAAKNQMLIERCKFENVKNTVICLSLWCCGRLWKNTSSYYH